MGNVSEKIIEAPQSGRRNDLDEGAQLSLKTEIARLEVQRVDAVSHRSRVSENRPVPDCECYPRRVHCNFLRAHCSCSWAGWFVERNGTSGNLVTIRSGIST